MKNELKISLIGCGRIGFLLEKDPLRYKPCTHFGGLLSAGLKTDSACDIDSRRLSEFAKTADLPEKKLYRDYRTLFKKESPDIAIIATWTETHAQIADHAVKNGVKLIILEKPMTSDLKSAEKLIEAAEKNGTKIIVNHERRFDPAYVKVKKMISEEVIGRIKSVHASVFTGKYKGSSKAAEGGGPLLHDGTHIVDIIRFFLGEIRNVSGKFHRDERDYGFEDYACATLTAGDDVTVFIEAGGSRDYFTFEIELYGVSGRIIIGNGIKKLFKNVNSDLYSGFKDLKEIPFPEVSGDNCFTELYREAIRVIESGQNSPVSSSHDGYMALQAIHSIYFSSYNNGKRIDLPVKSDDIDIHKIFKIK